MDLVSEAPTWRNCLAFDNSPRLVGFAKRIFAARPE